MDTHSKPIRLADERENLLVLLYRLAHRQQENFTTEAFVHLLQYLVEREPEAAVRTLDWLTGSDFFSNGTVDAPIRIRTQVRTEEYGIPDIRISSDDLALIVEVKLGGDLTFDQANAYVQLLKMERATRKALIALVGWEPLGVLPEGIRVRTWRDLGQRLLEETEGSESELTKHLVGDLVGLLQYLHLMPARVRSPVSHALSAHRQWAELNPGEPAVTRTRIKSIERLRDMEHCGPLKDLLLQMDHVLAHHPGVSNYLFDSGPTMTPPWIGFNVNDMRYFFYLPLNAPHEVTLQRYRGGVDPDRFDRDLGILDDSRSDGIVRWRVTLDLADPDVGYFQANRNGQLQALSRFFDRAFTYGETLVEQ